MSRHCPRAETRPSQGWDWVGGGNTEGVWCESVRRVQAGDGGGGRDRGTHPACREGGGHTLAPSPWARQQASLGSASEPQGRGGVSTKGPARDADGQTDRWTESQNWRLCICSPRPSTRKPWSEPGRWAEGGLVPGSGLPAAPPAPASAGALPATPPSAMGLVRHGPLHGAPGEA